MHQLRHRFGQKAPSAIRCIKTPSVYGGRRPVSRQKAPSAIRCIKTLAHLVGDMEPAESEST